MRHSIILEVFFSAVTSISGNAFHLSPVPPAGRRQNSSGARLLLPLGGCWLRACMANPALSAISKRRTAAGLYLGSTLSVLGCFGFPSPRISTPACSITSSSPAVSVLPPFLPLPSTSCFPDSLNSASQPRLFPQPLQRPGSPRSLPRLLPPGTRHPRATLELSLAACRRAVPRGGR